MEKKGKEKRRDARRKVVMQEGREEERNDST